MSIELNLYCFQLYKSLLLNNAACLTAFTLSPDFGPGNFFTGDFMKIKKQVFLMASEGMNVGTMARIFKMEHNDFYFKYEKQIEKAEKFKEELNIRRNIEVIKAIHTSALNGDAAAQRLWATGRLGWFDKDKKEATSTTRKYSSRFNKGMETEEMIAEWRKITAK